MVSQKLLLELKQIIAEDYKQKLSLEDVMDVATTLLGFTEALLKIESKTGAKNKYVNDYEKQKAVTTS